MGNYHIDIGKQLKALRLEQKREIKDIAKDTRVSEIYLEAIEAGRVEEFPSTVYYNLFARSYARELGQDPDLIFVVTTAESLELERVEALGPSATEDEIKALEITETNNNGSLMKIGIWIAVVVIIVFVGILFIFNSGNESEQPADDQALTNDTSETLADTAPDIMPDTTVSSIESEPIAEAPLGPEMKLRIDVIDLSWILVMADGDTILNRNLDSGSYRTVSAYEQFLLSIGNPNGLVMKLNDTLLRPLSPTGRPVRDFEITNSNKNQLFQVVEDLNSGEPGLGEL